MVGSGRASMSDSWTREKPSMEDPSKSMPSSKAVSSSAGVMANDFRNPSTSVNQRRMKRMPRSSTVRSTYSSCFAMGFLDLPGRHGTAPAGVRERRRRARPGGDGGVYARGRLDDQGGGHDHDPQERPERPEPA